VRVVLVPGFWLAADSWSMVEAELSTNGVTFTSITLPGLGDGTPPASVRLSDQIDFLAETIARIDGDVVLVGHSGAGPICHAAASRHTERVRRIIHVDTWPLPPGRSINAELADDHDVVPLPDWSVFENEDLIDLDDELRARFRAMAHDQPAAVARDPFPEMDASRFDIPTTIICCEFTSAQLKTWMSAEAEIFAETSRMRTLDFVDLPTGHWPQFTKPHELAAALLSLAWT
jgi:pimeloyl-ACP methyl ester carboxylesterase